MSSNDIIFRITDEFISRYDVKYNFMSSFNRKNGSYIRTGILKDGIETDEDPFMASYPHLIDVGIMGYCIHGSSGLCAKAGIECYQNGFSKKEENMSLQSFERICIESTGLIDQIALGGRGDPDFHEEFEIILKTCEKYAIVPNYTTSGLLMNKEKAVLSKRYCGAVAVSWYRSEYTLKAINLLLKEKVKTNIHFVVDNNSIDTCEGARFSMYISPKMVALPCSFDQEYKFAYDISNDTITNAWNSKEFTSFRNILRNSCSFCNKRHNCFGGCPLKKEIVLCKEIIV